MLLSEEIKKYNTIKGLKENNGKNKIMKGSNAP